MKAHITYIEDETGADTDKVLAYIHPASQDSVNYVLAQSTKDKSNGRSQWVWVRLQNGDLCLAVFPYGDTYLALEADAQYPHKNKKK